MANDRIHGPMSKFIPSIDKYIKEQREKAAQKD